MLASEQPLLSLSKEHPDLECKMHPAGSHWEPGFRSCPACRVGCDQARRPLRSSGKADLRGLSMTYELDPVGLFCLAG